MRRTYLLPLLALAVGCGRGAPPAPLADATGLAPVQLSPEAAHLASLQGEQVYEGRTAGEWATRLQDPAQLQRHKAASALGQMNDAGFPHLLQGMRSGSPEVRSACLQAVYKPVLVKHERETFDLLVNWLDDRDASLRAAALSRLAWFESRGGRALPQIRWIALNDKNAVVREAAMDALYQISAAQMPGLTHDDFNKKVLGQR